MAKGKKTGGRDFEPGKPGGPGRPPLLPEARGLPKFDKASLSRFLNEAFMSTEEESLAITDDKSQPVIRRWVHSMALKGFSLADTSKFDALLNRIVGKVKDEVESTGQIELVIKDYRAQDVDK